MWASAITTFSDTDMTTLRCVAGDCSLTFRRASRRHFERYRLSWQNDAVLPNGSLTALHGGCVGTGGADSTQAALAGKRSTGSIRCVSSADARAGSIHGTHRYRAEDCQHHDGCLAASGFCDAEHVKDVEAFFQSRMASLPGGARNLANTLERIRLCAARAEVTRPAVVEFLEKQ